MTFVNRVSVEILNDAQMEEYRLNQLKTCHTFWNVEFQTEGDYEAEGALGSEWSDSDWEEESNWDEEEYVEA